MDEKEQKPKGPPKEIQPLLQEKREDKLTLLKEVKSLGVDENGYTVTQKILQEIMAGHTIKDPNKLPPVTELVDELKEEIAKRYEDQTDLRDLLISSIPAVRSVREWVKKDGWDTAVWGYIRADGLFTASKRAQMIESLRTRGLDKSDVAAKIWLTLSGDYSEKMEVDNKSVEVYREISKVLHKKKEE